MKAPATHEKMTSALDLRRHYTQLDLFVEFGGGTRLSVMPKPDTVKAAVLKRLLGGSITQRDFDLSWRLAAYIDELRRDGWMILSQLVERAGCNGPIAEYTLDLQDAATSAAAAACNGRRGAK